MSFCHQLLLCASIAAVGAHAATVLPPRSRLCFCHCLFVCWLVCLLAGLREKLWLNFCEIFGRIDLGTGNNLLDFVGDIVIFI